ncbi:tRNA (adenosine(37)-N6)-threonylcarbamoyltransferase complex transferase subunit TsaD [Patescibacteria group bacterium]|nr:tRNA (adenosine(37)-N6)-threonylcarbamoyltransferase complex transferase subunit TsaD [Patescibacteria group bacterium]MBU1906892.1 tRNA (adenosine(37)-N6)-threonylcarbamoyltransferase complex transferase subunit TsaD [Patescibacteria group bacterium]
MKILGIETSCDETAVALVEGEGDSVRVVKSLVASQVKDHAKYGGVVPEVAARKHVDVLFGLLMAAKIDRTGQGIDAIAVTRGPGLAPALRVGTEAAKTLATLWGKPLVGVNHLEGHLYSVLLGTTPGRALSQVTACRLSFPALGLIVSGGHTELVLISDYGKYELIGETRDDAAGEAYDKVAKLLELGYPGGPIISKLAKEGDRTAINFPRPMLESGDFDFSFSGLKTAVLYYLRDNGSGIMDKADVCASFQEAVIDVLVAKTAKAIEQFAPNSVLLGGGVSANPRLRSRLKSAVKKHGLDLLTAPIKYTGDNAAMIATVGYFRARANEFDDPLKLSVEPNLEL